MFPISEHLHRSFHFITVLYRGTLELESVWAGEYIYYSWNNCGSLWREYVNSYVYVLRELVNFVKNALAAYELDFKGYSRQKKHKFYLEASDLYESTWAVNLLLIAFCYFAALIILVRSF